MRLLLLAAAGAALWRLLMGNNDTTTGTGMNLPRPDRIRLHRQHARIVAQRNGVPKFADWAVGQAGAESDYGNSPLYARSNNPFGIKAGSWLNDPKRKDQIVLAADGKTYYRKFATLEAAYQHLVELYRDMVPQYRPAFPLVAAGQYEAFALAVGPIYEPLRPARGKGSYAELVLGCIKAAQAVS